MDKKTFEKELKKQPKTVDMKYMDEVIDKSLSNITHNYPGLKNAIIVMEECGELIQEIMNYENGKNNRSDLLQELADVELGIYWLMKIFKISEEELENTSRSKGPYTHVEIMTTKVLGRFVQEISKAIRDKNDHNELLQSMVDTRYAIRRYMKRYDIKKEELNKAMNVKLNRQKKRGLNY